MKDLSFKRDVKTGGYERCPWFYFGDGVKVSDVQINDMIKKAFEQTKKEGHTRIGTGDTVVHGHKWENGDIFIDVCTSEGVYHAYIYSDDYATPESPKVDGLGVATKGEGGSR